MKERMRNRIIATVRIRADLLSKASEKYRCRYLGTGKENIRPGSSPDVNSMRMSLDKISL